MTIGKNLCVTLTSMVLTLSLGSLSQAQMTRLNVGYSATSGDQLPAWVAKDSGIFAKNGLDVQVIFFTGGTTAVLALVSGDVPIAQISGPGVVNSVLAGSDAVFIAAGMTSLNYVLMGKPGVKTAEQMRGGTLAISRFGSATDSIARFALRKVGLTPGKDITIVQVGSGPERLSAITHRQSYSSSDQSAVELSSRKARLGHFSRRGKNGLGVSAYRRGNHQEIHS